MDIDITASQANRVSILHVVCRLGSADPMEATKSPKNLVKLSVSILLSSVCIDVPKVAAVALPGVAGSR